jgi:hypothetical protein
MPGLLYRVVEGGCAWPRSPYEHVIRPLEALLAGASPYDITAARELIAARAAAEPNAPLWVAERHWRDLSPPSSTLFMEFSNRPAAGPAWATGVLIHARDLTGGHASGRAEADEAEAWWAGAPEALSDTSRSAVERFFERRPPGVRWWLRAAPFFESPDRRALGPSLVWNTAVFADGRPLCDAAGLGLFVAQPVSSLATPEAALELSQLLLPQSLHPALFALNLLNSPGVRTVPAAGPVFAPGARAQRRTATYLKLDVSGYDAAAGEGDGVDEEWPDVIGE